MYSKYIFFYTKPTYRLRHEAIQSCLSGSELAKFDAEHRLGGAMTKREF